jgi:hypothetical protein
MKASSQFIVSRRWFTPAKREFTNVQLIVKVLRENGGVVYGLRNVADFINNHPDKIRQSVQGHVHGGGKATVQGLSPIYKRFSGTVFNYTPAVGGREGNVKLTTLGWDVPISSIKTKSISGWKELNNHHACG